MSFELARQEIERQAKMYKAFEEAHNALVALASLEQHTKELQKSKSALEASLASLNASVKDKQDKLVELDTQILSARETVETTLREEEEKRRNELETQWKVEIGKQMDEVTRLELRCSTLREAAINYETYTKTKQAELTQLEQKISSAKEQIQRILNGNA